jgi:hypothetical protein
LIVKSIELSRFFFFFFLSFSFSFFFFFAHGCPVVSTCLLERLFFLFLHPRSPDWIHVGLFMGFLFRFHWSICLFFCSNYNVLPTVAPW